MKKFIHRVVTGVIAALLILVVGTIALVVVNLCLIFVGLVVVAKCLAFWIPLDEMIEGKKPHKHSSKDEGPRNHHGIPMNTFQGRSSLN